MNTCDGEHCDGPCADLNCWQKDGPAIKVGPDGFVRFVDMMGDDHAIVQAARVSYGKGTKTPSDDQTLINHLMRHGHTTPFEMVEFKFHVRVPMDTWRQWIRHRTASVNEYSTRYSEAIDSMATTDVWRSQSKTNKQGSGTDPIHWPEDPARERVSDDPNMHLSIKELEFHDHARCIYKERLAMGVAREQARKDLPLSTYTEAYWKIDLHNLFHFLDKRLRSDAQQEIREFAEAIAQLISSRVPMAWAAFKCYKMNAVTFSDHEMLALHNMLVDTELTPLTAISKFTTNDRERKEFVAKVMPC